MISKRVDNIVTVKLGARSYDICIGRDLLCAVGKMVDQTAKTAKCVILTDDHVNALHGEQLRNYLTNAGIDHNTITIEAGERSKSWPVFHEVVDSLLGLRLERSDLVLAFGGGVVGDLAGFAASVVRRGMRFLQIPTSLLAQVDSSVGGKTGINSKHGKNLVGAFHQPAGVLIDLDLLKTLPEREFRAGYAEVIKYGLIGYPEFFTWLEARHRDIFALDEALSHAVATSCSAKSEIVAADETERGGRALLNLGHTFGHALEGYTGYDGSRLIHGEGVAIGMMLAYRFSNRLNLCSTDDIARVEHHLRAVGLPTSIAEIPGDAPQVETLMKFIAQDKKVKGNSLTFILTKGIGHAYIAENVPPAEVQSFLEDQLKS